ncbi:hypothetical protein L596_008954 [Steinernema carpocapsae]|uniref:Uncharacterized protein n=1 Tax=Steinernema carpocapsae TaxID=34508 RepID=A0A4U5PEA6_STECR|nr:hypothetical protein L596_008954 [Steinernema carpocapsae]
MKSQLAVLFTLIAFSAIAVAKPNCDCNVIVPKEVQITDDMGKALLKCDNKLGCKDVDIEAAIDYAGPIVSQIVYNGSCQPAITELKDDFNCPALNKQIALFNDAVNRFFQGAKQMCRCGCHLPDIDNDFVNFIKAVKN